MNLNYNPYVHQIWSKRDESTNFHLRYSIISEEQDEEQIQLIKNCEEIDRYIISVIEHGETLESDESLRFKGAHRHVAIITKSRKSTKSIKSLIIKYKYKKNEIYFKRKYNNTTVTDMIAYIIKNGCFLSNWDEKVDEILGTENALNAQKKAEYEKNKKKAEDFRIKYKHMKEGNFEWFAENDPKYMLSNDFNRGIVWSQDDAKKGLKLLQNFYVVDKAGLGKTSAVIFLCDPVSYYLKSKTRDTFDGWNNFRHSNLHIDELDSQDATECIGGGEGIKEISTHAPFGAKFMYANRTLKIRPKRIFITANTHPEFVFNKDKHGKPVANIQNVKDTLKRRFKVIDCRTFHRIFGIKMVEINERRKASIICFDFAGMKEYNYTPKWEYFDEYLINKFKEHSEYWKKYGEDKYIQWRAYKEGIIGALKEINEKVKEMNNFISSVLEIKIENEEEDDKIEYMDPLDMQLNNLTWE